MAYNSLYQGATIDSILAKANSLGTGGVAPSATKLATSAGSATTPVYISSGVPVACSDLILFFTSKSVATSAWVSDSTYSDFPYRADISCSGVTANHYPEVTFSLADATSGTYAPISETASGIVKIWASSIPSAAITIPTIKCTRAS